MANIAAMGRRNQPGLIIVDRAEGTELKITELLNRKIPASPLDYPWETCMTMAGSWSYMPGDKYKSAFTIIHNLVDIVA